VTTHKQQRIVKYQPSQRQCDAPAWFPTPWSMESPNCTLDDDTANQWLFRCFYVVLCVCLFVYGPFCHGVRKLNMSILFTIFFLFTSLQFILTVGSRPPTKLIIRCAIVNNVVCLRNIRGHVVKVLSNNHSLLYWFLIYAMEINECLNIHFLY